MTGFYSEMVDTTEELLTEFGQSITITNPAVSAYSPATGSASSTPTTQTVKAAETYWRAERIAGTMVLAGDKTLIAAPTTTAGAAVTQPSKGWTVTLANGDVWPVEAVEPITPAGTMIAFVFLLRKG